MNVAHFGTFDVENYGDLLFPLILERRLEDIVGNFVHASPRGGSPVWGDCVQTVSTDSLLCDPAGIDAVVVGGGNIIHAGPTSLGPYDRGGLSALVAYPQLWLSPSSIALRQGVPLIWNAPGVQQPFSAIAARLVRWATSMADYVAVRDVVSLSKLRDAGITGPCDIVPDTALEVSRLWTSDEIDAAYEQAFVQQGRSVPDGSIVFHLNARYLSEDLESIAARLDRICQQRALTPILVAIGPCHGDADLHRQIASHMACTPLVIDHPQSLREVAACIARSEAYLGSSLHGMITACSFGTRGIAVIPGTASTVGKFSGFLEPFSLARWRCDSWEDAENTVSDLFATPLGCWERVIELATPALDRHWERVRTTLLSAAEHDGQPAAKRDHKRSIEIEQQIVGDSLPTPAVASGIVYEQAQRLPALLATLEAHRRQSAEAAAESDRVTSDLQYRLAEAEDRLGAAEQARSTEREELDAKLAEVEGRLQASEDARTAERHGLEERLAAAEDRLAAAEAAWATERDGLESRLVATDDRLATAEAARRTEREQADAKLAAAEAARAAERQELEAKLAETARQLSAAEQARTVEREGLEARLAAADEARAAERHGLEARLAGAEDRLAAAEVRRTTEQAGLEAQLAAVEQARTADREELEARLAAAEQARAAERQELETTLIAIEGRRAAAEETRRSDQVAFDAKLAAAERARTAEREGLEAKLAEASKSRAAEQTQLEAKLAATEQQLAAAEQARREAAQILGLSTVERTDKIVQLPHPPRSKSDDYQRLVERVREIATSILPPGAGVLVVSKGDEALLRLGGRRARHFPQGPDGGYAGHHPADGAAAVAHLEALRAAGGADYLLFPRTAFWWLDHYRDFARHLRQRYDLVLQLDEECLIFGLRDRRVGSGQGLPGSLQDSALADGSVAGTAASPHASAERRIAEFTEQLAQGDTAIRQLHHQLAAVHSDRTQENGHRPISPPSSDPPTDSTREARRVLLQLCEAVVQRSRVVDRAMSEIASLPTSIAKRGDPRGPGGAAAGPAQRTPPLPERVPASLLHQTAEAKVPAGATVLVVTKGDEELLTLNGRRAWHFPRTADGGHAGFYPADGAAAIAHLEELRTAGADYLLFPSNAFWWLDHYHDFKEHLDRSYQMTWKDERCIIYRLQPASPGDDPHGTFRHQPQAVDRTMEPVSALAPRSPASSVDDTSVVVSARPVGGRSPGDATRPAKPTVAVVAWDLTHNPLGRAYLLADVLSSSFDVKIVGTKFPRYGNDIWEPLRDADIPIDAMVGSDFPQYFRDLVDFADGLRADAVYVSKPRIPSYELGILLKSRLNCPLILDVDDYELSFFPDREPLQLDDMRRLPRDEDWLSPHGNLWTRYGESIIPHADLITTSNEALRQRYGGIIVPHARNEVVFDPALYDRDLIRARFGYEPDDRVVLFLGTPRLHKGFLDVAEALEALNNPRYKLCIIGTVVDPAVKRRIDAIRGTHVQLIPNQSFASLPANLCVADLVCVLQDPASEVSKYQMPAKVTDALSMGVPILATDVPPLKHLADRGLVELLGDATLPEKIDEIFSNYDLFRHRAEQNRDPFLESFSYRSAAATLEPRILELLERRHDTAPEYAALIDFHRSEFAPESRPPQTSLPIVANRTPVKPPNGASKPGSSLAPRHAPYVDDRYSIVFFWKQNDSDLYGRRQDMLVKYLARHPRVHSILHFDAPIQWDHLRRGADFGEDDWLRQGPLVFENTLKRSLRLADSDHISRYSFIYDHPGQSSMFPPKDRFADFVKDVLHAERVRDRRTIFWVCPVQFDFPNVLSAVEPDLVVADIIDDHRKWPLKESYRLKVEENYRQILARADIVFANCEPVRASMAEHRGDIHVVPNALEVFPDEHVAALRAKGRSLLGDLTGPVVGYSGNLDPARLDIPLLEHIASTRPDWNLVLIGSAHLSGDVRHLERHPNVRFLGVVPYEEALAYIARFDVAIIPHKKNELTDSMNPLKAYVYASLNVPVVSTQIANIDSLRSSIRVAENHLLFVASIQESLDAHPGSARGVSSDMVAQSWDERVTRVMSIIDERMASQDRPEYRHAFGSHMGITDGSSISLSL